MSLADLFPQEDYGFHMRFERGQFSEFFGRTGQHAELIAQRCHWLQTAPETYAAILPEGVPLLEEAIDLAREAKTVTPDHTLGLDGAVDSFQRCLGLGMGWEPDFLLLRADRAMAIRLLGGCVCFPSYWSLREKMGLPIENIHGVVPGLNPALGNQIQGFLAKLRPGVAWLRANWGLSRSPELNQHPERKPSRLDATTSPGEIWIRVEHQALVALPRTGGVLFGIRLALHPLAEVQRDPQVARALKQALKTMPESMAEYKGLARARAHLISWLER